jgi:Protein of unknown function (DUF4232)
MRARASLVWRVATAVAFGVTAALAVTLSRGAPINAALTSDKGTGATHAAAPAARTVVTERCAVAGLRISLGPGARVTAAITRYALEFTNVSGAPCTLAGYPQVTAYRGGGVLIGLAAARDPSVAARRILIGPGQTAHAVLDATAPARCRSIRAAGLRVVAPGQTVPRYVRRSMTTCAARGAHGRNYLLVRAIQAGAGAGGTGGSATVADVQPPSRAARLPVAAA